MNARDALADLVEASSHVLGAIKPHWHPGQIGRLERMEKAIEESRSVLAKINGSPIAGEVIDAIEDVLSYSPDRFGARGFLAAWSRLSGVCARARMERDALAWLLRELVDREDILDGSDGTPRANEAMSILVAFSEKFPNVQVPR